jgi:hypothetical protein
VCRRRRQGDPQLGLSGWTGDLSCEEAQAVLEQGYLLDIQRHRRWRALGQRLNRQTEGEKKSRPMCVASHGIDSFPPEK